MTKRRPTRCSTGSLPRLATVLFACACTSSTEGAATCVDVLDVSCTPAYEPTYDALYRNLFSKSCGAAATGNVCHYAPASQDRLKLSDIDQSYDNLLGLHDGRARVLPGDPACSTLVARIESNDPAFRMPVGSAALSLGERCVVRQWIAEGAKR